uniref:Uncharacterized protein n=1 Tax=Romanomermis culicivorax TaxID=13658 RepID=A0A915J538_ROMCU
MGAIPEYKAVLNQTNHECGTEENFNSKPPALVELILGSSLIPAFWDLVISLPMIHFAVMLRS